MLSPNKTKYFKATVHDGDKEMAVLSYNTGLHDLIEKAKVMERPIKIDGFVPKLDEFTNSPLLMLAARSTLSYSQKVIPYDSVKQTMEKINTFNSLHNITGLAVEEMVNIEAYVEIETTQTTEITTKFGPRTKRDVFVFDDSMNGATKLTLWNKFIDLIPESGSYKFRDLRIKSFGQKYLTTTATTVIEPSDKAFANKHIIESSLTSEATVSLPATTINTFDQVHFCRKCFRKAVPNGLMLICDFCGSKSLLQATEHRFQVKATFEKDDDNVCIVIPHKVFVKFAELLNIDLANTDELQVQLLTDNTCQFHFLLSTNTATDVKQK